ncbi:hypothetical protein C1H46_014812 [Malus baccata]|uniref:Uncharacterized protein n=1 Tax=Malus baccata TaxID=106549 RepID=A0A540ML93_MALBA|nr:hypothetical protein C1H46_014812 [Malus baccata]
MDDRKGDTTKKNLQQQILFHITQPVISLQLGLLIAIMRKNNKRMQYYQPLYNYYLGTIQQNVSSFASLAPKTHPRVTSFPICSTLNSLSELRKSITSSTLQHFECIRQLAFSGCWLPCVLKRVEVAQQ